MITQEQHDGAMRAGWLAVLEEPHASVIADLDKSCRAYLDHLRPLIEAEAREKITNSLIKIGELLNEAQTEIWGDGQNSPLKLLRAKLLILALINKEPTP